MSGLNKVRWKWFPVLSEIHHSKNRLIRSVRKMSTSKSPSPKDLLKLKERGIFENVFPNTRLPELKTLLEKPQSVYCGFDPTADSLHIGNLISIIALIHAQRVGHSPIVVLGGATARIGDPSGKTKDRPMMTDEQVEKNVESLMENVHHIINSHQENFDVGHLNMPKFRILNNREWYEDTNVVTFLSTTGRHFRIGEMMTRHSVQSRLNSKDGISCTEFMYQVFQAADWLHLYQNHGCTIQLGGNDQIGNMTSGFDLIHKVTNEFVFGFSVPLLLSPSGKKLGKSSGNSLWLNKDRTSPYEFYQYFINVPDSEVERYLKLFTFLSIDEIDVIITQHLKEPEKRLGQHRLADSVTTLVHGASGLMSAQKYTEVFFQNSVSALQSLRGSELQQLFQDIQTKEMALDSSLTVMELAKVLQCFKTDAEAERIIKAGGFYLNQQRINDPSHRLADGNHILSNNVTLVRVGKKTYNLVKWNV